MKTFNQYTLEEAKVHPMAVHAYSVGGGNYKVHAVGSKVEHVKAGETIRSSDLDDLTDAGHKVKEINKPMSEARNYPKSPTGMGHSSDAHFNQQSQKMQDAINMHLRKGKDYPEAVKAAKVHVKEAHSSDSIGDHKGLKAYANSLGPKHIDRHDLLTAASHMAFGNMDHLTKHLKTLDTDVRDKVKEYMKEEVDQIDELKHSGGVLNNYLSKTNPDRNTPGENKKRAAGRGLALGKKWGKALGINQPKVSATNEEADQIDEANSHRKVDDLKSKGKHHEAGVLAAKSSHDRQYGAHFGMRSGKEEAQRQFFKGYDSVKKTNEEADYIGYNFGGQFKDSSEWENAAKKRGLVVKLSTHPSGEVIKYQIAKDKSGNNRGHFDHGTKSGRLTEEADIDEALGTIKNIKAASKFSSSNVSDMIRGEKARKAGMAKVSTTKDIGYKVVDVGPGQKETVRKMHNFKEEEDLDEASSAMKSLASKKKSGIERAHKETHGISPKRFAIRQTDKSKPTKHRVDIHVVTNNGEERKYQDEVDAKDKHDAIFSTQIKYGKFGKKMGYSVDKVVHKGMVKEESESVDEAESGLSTKTLANYSIKASDASKHRKLPTSKVDNRYAGVSKVDKILAARDKKKVD